MRIFKAIHLGVLKPLTGDELAASVAKVSRTSPAVVKRARDMLDLMQTDAKH